MTVTYSLREVTDQLKLLQVQVESLKERLDFLGPRVSELSVVQDYFQSVEKEASLQVSRLSDANLIDAISVFRRVSERDSQTFRGEKNGTADWLYNATEILLRLKRTLGTGPCLADSSPACLLHKTPTRHVAGESAATPQKSPSTNFDAWSPQSPKQEARRPFGTEDAAAALTRYGLAPVPEARSHTSSYSRGYLGVGGSGLSHSQSAGGWRTTTDGLKAPVCQEDPLLHTLEYRGLSLGQGTWANAYRRATGQRRDALRLLATHGIITQRELADDLTVVDEAHIEECVVIGLEALQRWPPERGPPQEAELKVFFQKRLEAAYLQRAPSPIGIR